MREIADQKPFITRGTLKKLSCLIYVAWQHSGPTCGGTCPSPIAQGNPMARIARTKNHRPVEAAAEPIADRTPGTARDTAEKGTGTTLRLIGEAAAAAEGMARGSPDAGQQSVVPPTHAAAAAAFGMVEAGGALAGFWLEQVNRQMA